MWRRFDGSDPAPWMLLLSNLWVALAAFSFANLYHFNVIDDAYISFQYTRNLVSGNGVVFNPGEYVEGYTNFLWIVVLAPFYAIANALSAQFTPIAISVSIVLALVDLTLLFLIARRLFHRDWVAITLTLFVCALDNAYVGYAMGALEIHLLIAFVLGAILIWMQPIRRRWFWTALLLAGACMTRPDAGIVVATFGLSSMLGLIVRDPDRAWESRAELAKQTALTIGVWLVVYGAYFAWRYSYYGALLPNTFYLKVGSQIDATERGLVYSLAFLEDRYYLPALAGLTLLWPRNSILRWLVVLVVAHATYVTYVGGDFYSGHRFYVVLLPILALQLGWVVHRLRAFWCRRRPATWLKRRTAIMAVATGSFWGVVAFGFALFAARGFERGPYTHEITLFGEGVHNNIQFTRWLGEFTRSTGGSIVVGDIGSTGFFTNLVVYDVYGVIDPTTARMQVKDFGKGKAGHEKRAPRAYLLSKNPTYVKWGYIAGDLRANNYFIFTDFPPGFRQGGLWVRENLDHGHFLQEHWFHFDPDELRDWKRTGNSFQDAPTRRPVHHQAHVFGQNGSYINSFSPKLGDRATGALQSPPFPLVGDLMVLSVGGGRDPERLRVSLLIDGARIFSATGHDHEVLGRRVWDIAPHRGKTARLEIVDNSTDGWGHILVDEVAQWSR